MDRNQVFRILLWTLAAIVLICGFHGCRKSLEDDHRHGEAMAERGYEYIGGNWIRR